MFEKSIFLEYSEYCALVGVEAKVTVHPKRKFSHYFGIKKGINNIYANQFGILGLLET